MDREKLEEHKRRVQQLAIKYIEEYGWTIVPTYLGQSAAIIHYKQWRLPADHPEYVRPPEADEMLSWFDDNPPVNTDGVVHEYFDIAAVTGAMSGIVVVDCDNPEATIKAKELGLTSPAVVKSKAGHHYYWHHDGQIIQPNKVGHIANRDGSWPECNGLDLRGDGGIIRLPPSFSKGMTHHYEWVNEFDVIEPEFHTWKPRKFPVEGAIKYTEKEKAELKKQGVYVLDFTGVSSEDSKGIIASIEAGIPVRKGGRNDTVTAIVGELVAKRHPIDNLFDRVQELMELPNWIDPLDDKEVERCIESILAADKLAMPEKYDGDDYVVEPEPEVTAPVEFKQKLQPLITGDILEELRQQIGEQKFLMYPALTSPAIMQVYGYSGHGKSLFTAHLLYCATIGRDFGVFENRNKARVLYLDFENSLGEIVDRMQAFRKTFPGCDDSGFAVYSPAMKDGTFLTLDRDEGIKEVLANAEAHDANVIVIDTYRTAFNGFTENDSASWAAINKAMLILRNNGYAVIGLHHANKVQSSQGKSGTVTQLGSEAGSTAQLNLLEVQLRITQIYPDTEAGRSEAEETKGIVDDTGWEALQKAKLKKEGLYDEEYRIRTAIKVTYGKVRNRSAAHRTSYIGFAEADDGHPTIIASTPLRQRVRYQLENGKTIKQVVDGYDLPNHLVTEWAADILEKTEKISKESDTLYSV